MPYRPFRVHLVVCVLLALAARESTAQSTLSFRTVGPNEGLSHPSVMALEVDRDGYMWAGTLRGLNRNEGTRVEAYMPLAADSTSIPSNRVDAIHQASNGDIWVGFTTGFARYDPVNDAFVRYTLDTPSPPIVHAIEEGPGGRLYLGTWTYGLIEFDPTSGTSRQVFTAPHPQLDGPTAETLTIRDIAFYDGDHAWITSYTGVWTLDASVGQIGRPAWPVRTLDALSRLQSFSVREAGNHVLFASLNGLVSVEKASGALKVHLVDASPGSDWNYVRHILVTSDDQIWLATKAGIARFDIHSGAFEKVVPGTENGSPMIMGETTKLAEDHAGNIWVGTSQAGLVYIDRTFHPVPRVERGYTSSYTFPDGHVWSMAQTDDGSVWVGTSEGFGRWEPSTGLYESIPLPGIASRGVSAMLALPDGSIVLAVNGRGACRYRPRVRICEDLFQIPGIVYTIARTPDGDLWFGQFGHLYRYSFASGALTEYRSRMGGSADDIRLVLSLHVDPSGTLWAGMEFGLAEFIPQTDSFQIHDIDIERLLVASIHDAGDGRLWLAGTDQVLYDPPTGSVITRPRLVDEVPSGLLVTAVADAKGRLWLDTGDAIVGYAPDGFQEIMRIPTVEVRRTLDYTTTGTLRLSDGRVAMGYVNGFHIFAPDAVKQTTAGRQVDVVSVMVGDTAFRLPRHDRLHIDHRTRVLTFSLATTAYDLAADGPFDVKLDGFETEWRTIRSGTVTYTNLAPGTYTLRARISGRTATDDGTGQVATIVIDPPWWTSIWFLALVLGAGVATLYGVVRWRERDLTQRSDQLDALVQQRTSELAVKAQELQVSNELKSRFFSNVSHELRTPLTLIKGYLEDAEATASDVRLQRAIGLTDRLDALVTQLLDLARSDGNRHVLNATRTDLVSFVHRIVAHFAIAARRKQIDLTFEHDQSVMHAMVDPMKMDQVVSNLIGNALKYTPEGGAVWVTLTATKGRTVHLSVADSGPGIPEADQARVFERFFQAEPELTREHEGLGIGLALTRDFVELHGGRISVESEPGSGSVFHAVFPDLLQRSEPTEIHAMYHDLSEFEPEAETDRKRLLIVEDHEEIRSVLARQLGERFVVSEAADGRQAWEFIRTHPVDIVLSDVMMPGMSGLDLLREVRASEPHAHLPFVLLTARTGEDAQMEGLSALADDFITKPYSARILLARLTNLSSRGRAPAVSALPPEDEMLVRLRTYVHDHMSDTQLPVTDLADAVFMSVRTLQRRIKELTGDSAAAYVRGLRLAAARALLESGDLTSVSEAAHRTGFSNVSYFSKLYEDTFGINPKSYM